MREHPTSDRAARPAAASYAAPSRADAAAAPTGAPILVAATGGAGSDAAVLLAHALAGPTGADVRVVSVAEPPIVLEPYMAPFAIPPANEPWLRDCRAGVERQLARAGLADAGWRTDVLVGEPARRIAGLARESQARLVLVGRARRGRAGGRPASRLALRLLQLADAPVLSVAAAHPGLPRRVVVGIDFSPYSEYAARIALSVAAPDAVVHLVHVRQRYDVPFDMTPASAPEEYATRVAESWRTLLAALGDPGDRQIETVTIAGDPGQALVEYARAAGAHLVATGTHGRGAMDRLLLGSVAAELLQHAECSVLCVPGSAVARAEHRRRAIAGMHTRTVPRDEWDAALAELTRSAAGRPCAVEVDHPDAGAQPLLAGLPFAGASYDRHGDRLVLSFGISRGARLDPDAFALSHGVRGARSLDVVSDAAGTVHVLRVADDAGQTIVTFGA